MQHLVLKKDLSPTKLEALLHFLKSWDIEAELQNDKKAIKKNVAVALNEGMWKDYEIDAKDLRKNAWKIQK